MCESDYPPTQLIDYLYYTIPYPEIPIGTSTNEEV
jgi:hypothetical protein